MNWVIDRTGRFQRRPHYDPDELDSECERTVSDFLRSTHGRVTYPISTDDLTVLIERRASDLDLYADLSGEDDDVEGTTDFYIGQGPRVRISKTLSTDPHMSNRFRTTLTHEFGHVVFHSFLFAKDSEAMSLFGGPSERTSNKCKRENILQSSQKDWMEWQAGYACGAFLMPVTALKQVVRDFIEDRSISVAKFASRSCHGQSLIMAVCDFFSVSHDAARVRLTQLGALQEGEVSNTLF